MKKSFLAGLSPAEFLRRHWQKKPLLARAGLSGYAGAITRDELFELATREDMESRIVTRSRGEFRVRHGPFAPKDFKRLARTGWTLLVQGVDQAHHEAARLLQTFSFIGQARLDDVMVSYAAPGGGVGPHFDSYDVFLVQGSGERRWQVSSQRDLDLVPGTPLKLLRDFRAEEEWRLIAYEPKEVEPSTAGEPLGVTCFRGAAGRVVPYKKVKFSPLPAFEVVLGASCPMRPEELGIRVLMDEKLGTRLVVSMSVVPVRA